VSNVWQEWRLNFLLQISLAEDLRSWLAHEITFCIFCWPSSCIRVFWCLCLLVLLFLMLSCCGIIYYLYPQMHLYIQDAAEITPTFGGVTARAVEGVQWWEGSRWLAVVLPFSDNAMSWSSEQRGFVVETFFKNNESVIAKMWELFLPQPVDAFPCCWAVS
jgi:hypothetical protein